LTKSQIESAFKYISKALDKSGGNTEVKNLHEAISKKHKELKDLEKARVEETKESGTSKKKEKLLSRVKIDDDAPNEPTPSY
jgi:hypothetical protein